MTGDQLAKFLADSDAEWQRRTAHLPKPFASVTVSREGMSLDVCLDTSKSTYSDWIPGEGADIGLLRDLETDKVAGAHLPLYAKTLIIGGDFGTIYINLELGTMEIETAKEPKE